MNPAHDALDRLHATYRRASPFDDCMRRYTFQTFKPFIKNSGASAIELGCSDGLMTQMIAEHVARVHVVEGSSKFLQEAQARKISNASFVHAMFEDFQSDQRFDYAFATFVLTHIADLKTFLGKVRSLLVPGGLLFVAVPNSRALSRQLARHMGLLNDLMDLSENDRNHGHCRAYDRVTLARDLAENGLRSIAEGGILMKPLADFQMDKLIEQEVLKQQQLDGLYSLGLEHPDFCGALFSVCVCRK